MVVKRIARVFPRKTQYTPDDDLVFFDRPGLMIPKVDEVHISCTFSWDRPRAEWLATQWKSVASVNVGGPAYPGSLVEDEFVPGRYLQRGYIVTSRGCCRKCEYCLVPWQEGSIRELSTIHPGNKLMDNNLLACSEKHISKVFDMLDEQEDVMLMGGLDVRLLKKWQAERIAALKLRDVAIAYDREVLKTQLERSLDLLHKAGVPHGKIHCFVLGGFFPDDTPEKAEDRCRLILGLGATPTAMFFRSIEDKEEYRPPEWSKWVVRWSFQRGIYAMAKREGIPTYQRRKDGS